MSIGLNASIYLAAGSLQAQTVGLTTTGSNISNANTPGATRQVVDLEQGVIIPTQYGALATGSFADQIRSVRSDYLDNQVQQQTSQLNYSQTSQQQYSLLQQSFGEDITNNQVSLANSAPTGTGIQNPLDAFYGAWQALANDPTNSVYRDAVSSNSGEITKQISSTYNQILSAKSNSFTQASDATQQINQLSTQIANLNEQISKAEGQMVQVGVPGVDPQANSLRDQRQVAITKLAQLVSLKVTINQGNLQDMVNLEIANANGGSQTPPVYLVYQKYGAGATDGTHDTVRLDVVATDPTAGGANTNKTSANVSGAQYDRSTNSAMTVIASTSTTTGLTPPASPNLTTILNTAPVTFAVGSTGQLAAGLKTAGIFDNLSAGTNSSISGGSLGAFVDQANNVIGVGNGASVGGSTVERFNNFVTQFVTEVNTQFNKGYNLATPTPSQPVGTATSAQTLTASDTLFSMTGTNASTLKLNSVYDINSGSYNRSYLPASGPNGGVSLGSLDGSNANSIALLAQAQSAVTTNTTPAPTTYRTVIAKVGSDTAAVTANSTQINLLLQQTKTQDSSLSGINMDEELANLTTYQHSYSASARFLSTCSQMLSYLIQSVGV